MIVSKHYTFLNFLWHFEFLGLFEEHFNETSSSGDDSRTDYFATDNITTVVSKEKNPEYDNVTGHLNLTGNTNDSIYREYYEEYEPSVYIDVRENLMIYVPPIIILL